MFTENTLMKNANILSLLAKIVITSFNTILC